MRRRLPDWIDGFDQHTNQIGSPPIWRTWAAISSIAGVLERRVWIRTVYGVLYPHLYAILIGPPGVGKSQLTSRVEKFWRGVEDQWVSPTNVSKASLIDALDNAHRTIVTPTRSPPEDSFNSLKVLSNELSVLLPAYDVEFMATLTDLYDCSPYHESKRGAKFDIDIPKPQFNLLAATTPSALESLLPDGAWDQGFLSRCLLVYSGDRKIVDPFSKAVEDKKLHEDLTEDFSHMARVYGEFTFDEAAAQAITKWVLGGGKPAPRHPKLQHYNTRRTAHLFKLCMVASISRSSELNIELQDYTRALGWLLEMEYHLPDIFKSMQGDDAKIIEEAWHFAYEAYIRGKEPVRRALIISFLMKRAPSHKVEYLLAMMVATELLQEKIVNKIGIAYIPQRYTTYD